MSFVSVEEMKRFHSRLFRPITGFIESQSHRLDVLRPLSVVFWGGANKPVLLLLSIKITHYPIFFNQHQAASSMGRFSGDLNLTNKHCQGDWNMINAIIKAIIWKTVFIYRLSINNMQIKLFQSSSYDIAHRRPVGIKTTRQVLISLIEQFNFDFEQQTL